MRRHRDARVLVFTADNESAYAVAREHLVMPFTCDIGRKEREEVLTWFREGKIRALVSARVLNEGIDVPDADVAIVVAGGLGEREHVQRVGRLLRPREGKRALVYELVMRNTIEVRMARRRRATAARRVTRSTSATTRSSTPRTTRSSCAARPKRGCSSARTCSRTPSSMRLRPR
jgi:superfamily II DNA or RNA helicase